MVLRLTADGGTRVISGPFDREARNPGVGVSCSATVLGALRRTRRVIVAANAPSLADGMVHLTDCAPRRELAIIACPIERPGAARDMDVLWVELPWSYATEQWGAVVELVVESYAHAVMVSEMRADLRAAARVEHDLELAREVQARLLPDCSTVAGIDVAVGYEPSHWVGGDYVDALHLDDGRVLLVIADVCGKGLSAALVSSSVHTMIHTLAATEHDLAALVGRVNRYLCDHLATSSFVTLLAIAIAPETGSLECVSAGHPPAFVASHRGELRWLQTERNVALGMLRDAQYEVEHTVLAPNDTLLMYTDGAFEMLDREASEPVELANLLTPIILKAPGRPAEELRRDLSTALDARRGEHLRTDDTTFLIARHHEGRRV